MPLFRPSRPQEIVSASEYLGQYRKRPTVPPASLYPLIRQALDVLYFFDPLSSRIYVETSLDLTINRTHYREVLRELLNKHLPDFKERASKLNNAYLSLISVRVEDSQETMIDIQIETEQYLWEFSKFIRYDSQSFFEIFNGNKKKYNKCLDLEKIHMKRSFIRKDKVKTLVKMLYENDPEQFKNLGLSIHNLLLLGLDDLDSPRPAGGLTINENNQQKTIQSMSASPEAFVAVADDAKSNRLSDSAESLRFHLKQAEQEVYVPQNLAMLAGTVTAIIAAFFPFRIWLFALFTTVVLEINYVVIIGRKLHQFGLTNKQVSGRFILKASTKKVVSTIIKSVIFIVIVIIFRYVLNR